MISQDHNVVVVPFSMVTYVVQIDTIWIHMGMTLYKETPLWLDTHQEVPGYLLKICGSSLQEATQSIV